MENQQLNKEIDAAHRKSIWVNFFQAVGVFLVIWVVLAYLPSEDTAPFGLLYAYIAVSMYPVIGYFYRVAKDFSGDRELEKIRHRQLSSIFCKEYDSETLRDVISAATSKISDGAERLMLSPELKETTLTLCTALRKAVLERIGYISDDFLIKILDLSLGQFQDLLEEIVNDPKEKELVLLITGNLAPVLAIRSKIVKEQIHLAEQNLITIKNKQLTASGKQSLSEHLQKTGQFKEPTREQIDASFNTPRFEERLIAFLRKTGQIKD